MKTISPIQISSQGRYFVDPQGNPVFWLGDTQWEMFRLFTPDEALHILQDRQSQGFTIILVMLTGVDTDRIEPGLNAPYQNLEGEKPWTNGDPLQPNEKYFQHIDQLIRLGEQTGQTFVVGIYHQWHFNFITLDKARAWARWVARRYREVPNLIWSMYPQASEMYIPVCRELASGLQEGDGGAHLISVHPDPSVASSSFIHDEPWLAFNMIQTCIDYDQIHTAVTRDYQLTPVKPVVMAEGGYEGLEFNKFQTAHHIRKQAFWTQLAGGHHVYGHNDAWRTPRQWDEWLHAPGSRDLRVFKEIFTAIAGWWDLIPDQSLLMSGAGSGYALNTATRSADGRWLLAYLSEPATISLRLDALSTQPQARAAWIDPTNGNRIPAGNFPAHGSQPFTTPTGWADALLLVEVG